MMIGPAPMMRIVEMSVRLGIYPLGPSPMGGGDRLVTTRRRRREPTIGRRPERRTASGRAAGLTRRESARGKGRPLVGLAGDAGKRPREPYFPSRRAWPSLRPRHGNRIGGQALGGWHSHGLRAR